MNFQIQKLFPATCEGCESVELCKKLGAETNFCGQWKTIDLADSLNEAIEYASAQCSFLDSGDKIIIVCPDGKII